MNLMRQHDMIHYTQEHMSINCSVIESLRLYSHVPATGVHTVQTDHVLLIDLNKR